MSIKGIVFKEISGHLEAQVEELIYIDKDRGQVEKENIVMVPKPAILIAFMRFEWSDIGNGIKEGKGIIRVRVICENYAESYTGSIDQEQALAFFDLNEKVDAALEGFSGTHFREMKKVSDEDDLDHNNIIVTVYEYETTIIDDTKANCSKMVKVDAEPVVKYVTKENLPERQVNIQSDFIL
ncbi:hypothetical protein [Chryseobacterium lathyri]|uniref:Uncharacterized protein n=1 Tax=Chryseobacterium lathyri TaxID=395933 RepID=A0A511Y8Q9_9FLAO|nr:hypothetical protein [Chryseobacterium lathyri]GEN71591.1 hypothetical protein CLA01_16630 [Chryseobacterium lathyri]